MRWTNTLPQHHPEMIPKDDFFYEKGLGQGSEGQVH